MPAVIVVEVVADDGDFGPLMGRPVVSRGRVAVARELSGRDHGDKIVGDRPICRVEKKVAFEKSAAEHDQKAKRERQPGEPDQPRGGQRRFCARQALLNGGHECAVNLSARRLKTSRALTYRAFLSAVLAPDQARLISRMMIRRITAPIKASMIAPITSPPNRGTPICGNNQPAMKAPTMPTTMSPIRPKPPPLTTMPASQPAIAPTISQIMMPMFSPVICFPGKGTAISAFRSAPSKA